MLLRKQRVPWAEGLPSGSHVTGDSNATIVNLNWISFFLISHFTLVFLVYC